MSTSTVAPSSLFARAGTVVAALAKHVIVRALLWAALGLVLSVAIFIAFVVGYGFADRSGVIGAALLGLYAAVGVAAFGAHGVARGVARATLEVENKFGVSRYLIDRVTDIVDRRFGDKLATLPLARLEESGKEAVAQLLGGDEALDGAGATRWLLRKVRERLLRLIERYLLRAFRAEATADGAGGGVSVARVRERLHAEVTPQLAQLVMGAINKQLALLVVGALALGLGWPYVLRVVAALFGR